MRFRLDYTLLAASLTTIVFIFLAALLPRSANITPRMFFLRIALGILFFLLGIVGSLLPVMQGWLFFLLSALVLFPDSKFAVKTLVKVEPRMPRLVRWLRKMGIGVPRDTIGA